MGNWILWRECGEGVVLKERNRDSKGYQNE